MIKKVIHFMENEVPKLTTYMIEDELLRPAVLILPGGGYEYTSPREGAPIALKFNAAGYHAFVLDYRVSPNRYPAALEDVAKAMKFIHDHHIEWNVDGKKITLCGFSAGGHLAASYSVYWEEFGLYKPDALILSYPVVTSGKFTHLGSIKSLLGENPTDSLLDKMALEKHIPNDFPNTFIWHTFEDQAVPVENTLFFVEGLRKQNIPFELHIYPKGGHGLSLATDETAENDLSRSDPHVATWFKLCLSFLDELYK